MAEYDQAWEDVHKAQSLNNPVGPEFLRALREASGREDQTLPQVRQETVTERRSRRTHTSYSSPQIHACGRLPVPIFSLQIQPLSSRLFGAMRVHLGLQQRDYYVDWKTGVHRCWRGRESDRLVHPLALRMCLLESGNTPTIRLTKKGNTYVWQQTSQY